MVPRNTDCPAHHLGVAHEHFCPLELARARPLREIAGHSHHVEAQFLDQRLDGGDLLGNGGLPEMQIGDVEYLRHCSREISIEATALTAASTASPGVPTRSRESDTERETSWRRVSITSMWIA